MSEQAPAQPANPEPEAIPEPEPTPEPQPEPEVFDQDRAMRTIQRQREAEKELKAQLAEARKAKEELDAIKLQQLSETERLQKERDDALAKAQDQDDRLRTANLRVALSGKEVVDVDAVAALLGSDVNYDDEGVPSNLEEVLEELLERKPGLRATAPTPQPANTNANAGNGNAPTVQLTADELAAANDAGMSPERFKALQGKDSGILTYDDWAKLQEQKQGS